MRIVAVWQPIAAGGNDDALRAEAEHVFGIHVAIQIYRGIWQFLQARQPVVEHPAPSRKARQGRFAEKPATGLFVAIRQNHLVAAAR